MKLAINARFLTQRVTGVQRYAREVVKELANILDRDQFILLAPANAPKDLDGIPVIRSTSRIRGHFWEQLVLPFMVKQSGVRVLWSPGNIGPIFVKSQVLTIHDASVFAHPEGYKASFSRWYRLVLPRLAKRVKKILTVSEFSCREIVRYLGIDAGKVSVIYNGVSASFQRHSEKELLNFIRTHNLPERFILALGSKGQNKNLTQLLKAWEMITQNRNFDDLWLVTVGGNERTLAPDSGSQFNRSPRIKDLGYVEDKKLPLLYGSAQAFVFPSLYEGFGLPPLEAMACGCPVIVANSASLPEICSDAALYCNPYSSEDILDKIVQLMQNKELRRYLQEKGLARSKKFSWELCARKTLSEIEKVLYR